MSLFDIKRVREEAEKEVSQETADKAKKALVSKLKQREAAKSVLANIEREIADLEASIADGSFIG